MSESDSGRDHGTVWDHLQRALRHAEEAARHYLALIEGKAEAWGRKLVQRIVLAAALSACALLAVVFIFSGLAQLIQALFPRFPGAGYLIVGGGILLGLCAALLLASRGKEKG